MTGTLINAAAVIAGSLIGLLIRNGLPKYITQSVFHVIGLFTLALGVSMAIQTGNYLLMIFSLVIGTIAGELLCIEKATERLADFVKKKTKSESQSFSEGFITSFLMFCMGSMTILGAVEEGLGDEPNLLLAKSVLDGFSSIALAASLGVGVLFSVVPLLIYQGGLTLFAGSLQDALTDSLQTEISAVGGILLIGLGLNILELKKINVLNMLPALIIVVLLLLTGWFE